MPATFYVGDAIEVMGKLPENSVDLILTSPPFLALRSYLPADHPDKGKEGGSQSTPGEFIDWLIDVVEACDRVLAPHGSLCIELGDTYAGNQPDRDKYITGEWSSGPPGNDDGSMRRLLKRSATGTGTMGDRAGAGWPLAKSLSLIPESFRWAMVYGRNPFTGRQTEPWRLRNVVRWVRPNPPVGALGDKFRPATSELMVFCKSAKRYFDLDAVRTVAQPGTYGTEGTGKDRSGNGFRGVTLGPTHYPRTDSHPAGAPPLDWWNVPLLEGEEETRYGPKPKPAITPRDGEPKRRKAAEEQRATIRIHPGDVDEEGAYWVNTAMAERTYHKDGGAPPLDWWEIPPGGYEGAHYAVFPPELCVKPVKAMSPERVCRVCGEPSRRIVNKGELVPSEKGWRVPLDKWDPDLAKQTDHDHRGNKWQHLVRDGFVPGHVWENITTGFTDCGHDDWRPGLVLDPFGGSGTTALVATGHGRDCILIDLDERNFDLALERVGPFILTLGSFDD